eukprot:s886_g8.t1
MSQMSSKSADHSLPAALQRSSLRCKKMWCAQRRNGAFQDGCRLRTGHNCQLFLIKKISKEKSNTLLKLESFESHAVKATAVLVAVTSAVTAATTITIRPITRDPRSYQLLSLMCQAR